jgi:methylated-DNA-[protein]-cysteine S-methyltransferase
MTELSYHLFETDFGWCGVIGAEGRLHGALLPEGNAEKVRARFLKRHPEARETKDDPDLVRAAARVRALIEGANDDLRDLDLDLSGVSDFERRVYEIAREVLPGQTTTYGDIARQVGEVTDSQAVGKALGRNPFAPIIPCHRVVAAGQKLGGFSATGGRALKLKMLAGEARWARDDLFGEGA